MSKDMLKRANQVADRLRKMFGPGVEFTCKKMFKTNRVTTAISIEMSGFTTLPIAHLEDFPPNMPVDKVAKQIACLYQEEFRNPTMDNIGVLPAVTKEFLLSKATLQVVSQKLNRELLRVHTHIDFLDLAGVFRITFFHSKKNHQSTLITNELMDSLKITLPELEAAAHKNTLEMFGVRFYGTEDFEQADRLNRKPEPRPLEEAVFGPRDNCITNADEMNGAALILFPEVLRKIGEMAGQNFLIVPTSIHELAVMYEEGEQMLKNVAMTLRSRNRDQSITPKDVVLSDNVYRYHIDTGEVEMAI